MDYSATIKELKKNRKVFLDLLAGLSKDEYLWKPEPDKWCIQEIVCHLHDEECEDFRKRTKHFLENKTISFTSIDPIGWVNDHNYIEQNYSEILNKFLKEREQSVQWLESLVDPKWNNTYHHPKLGLMTAKMFLCNWVAHDYLHIRQILGIKFNYLKQLSTETLNYAGNW